MIYRRTRRRRSMRRMRRPARVMGYKKRYPRRYKFFKPTRPYPEIKHMDIYTVNESISTPTYSTATATMFAADQKIVNPFQRISQGAGAQQRIGQSIFCKYMTLSMRVSNCLASGSALWTSMGHFRLIGLAECNIDTITAADQPAFWSTATTDHSVNLPFRYNYSIFYDKTFSIMGGINAGNTYPNQGAERFIKIKIPVNKSIKYTAANFPTDDRNQLTFAMYMTIPAYSGDRIQAACATYRLRMYFTDD